MTRHSMTVAVLALSASAALAGPGAAHDRADGASSCRQMQNVGALSGEERLEMAAQIALHSFQTHRLGAPTAGIRRALPATLLEQPASRRVSDTR